MDYSEARATADKIIKAVKRGKYAVSYGEPNNIFTCTAPDGRTFYKIVDMDGIKSCNDSGWCEIVVEDYTFTCDLGNGDYESDFFDELDEEYVLEDKSLVMKEEIEEEIIDAFRKRKDIFWGEYTEMEQQMEFFAKLNKIRNPEYYWFEETDCPINIDDKWSDYVPPKDLDYGTVYHNRCKYYLVEDANKQEGEQLHAVHCKVVGNDRGIFPTVLLTVDYKKDGRIVVRECHECDDMYKATSRRLIKIKTGEAKA